MIEIVRDYLAPAAYRVLPPAMKAPAATNLLLAIGYQESRFTHRVQVKGPARGFFQFEQGGGVHGVLSHAQTRAPFAAAWKALGYRQEITPFGVYCAIEHNDVLAFALARLLLWTLPSPLPTIAEPELGWKAYTRAWRPGRPHLETWDEAWAKGWAA